MTSRLAGRVAFVVCLCAALPVVLLAILFARVADSGAAADGERELANVSRLYSEVIQSRLGAAETLVSTLTAVDIGYDGAALKRRAAKSSAFKNAMLVDRADMLARGETTLRPNPAQLVALEAGETVLLSVSSDGRVASAFLVRAVNAAGVECLAYFELDRDWLWKHVDSLPSQTTLAVVDADARVLHNVGPLSADATHILAGHITLSGERAQALHPISWLAGGQQWRGVMQSVRLADERISAAPWAVVSFTHAQTLLDRPQSAWRLLPFALLVVLICAIAAGIYVARCYLPAMRAPRHEQMARTGVDKLPALHDPPAELPSRVVAASETGLQRALRRREFSLFYQPQFSVEGGALAGVEALLRWQTPRDGMRPPGDFVPAAEESGLIVDIGGWVLDAACAQLALWLEQNIAPPRLALNVSVQQLKHFEFPNLVRRALDKYGIAPALLELELTESVFADEAAGVALGRLAQLGVHLSLDDFGTGYSSLSYLKQYPIGTVKIDRSFLEEVPQSAASSTLVETIIVMAHALGKRVVAEGIETAEQLEFLREHRCDIAQGFFLARPLTEEAVTGLLQARTMAVNPQMSDVRAAS